VRPFALLAVVAALAACATAPTPASTVDVATIHFGHLPVGTVTAAGTPGAPTAHFDITGLQPDSVHSGRVDVTACGDKQVVPYPPGPVDIRADARGHATGDVPRVSVPFPLFFHLDVVPGGTAPFAAQELGCAVVRSPPVPLEVLDPYNRAGGEARLRYDRATRVLEVTVVVDGLAPRSHHPNHIHTGQCEMEGPVRDVLQPIDADATGRATVITRIPESDGIRRGVWYIAVHNGPQLGSQDQYAVLACGNVP
jgi:hypothetical protein